MFRWLIGTSQKFRVAVLAAAAAIVVYGAYQVDKMPIDIFPEFKPVTVEIQTEALGLSAKEVEKTVTLIIEELVSGVPWLETFRSRSVAGLSSIVLTFERGTDPVLARMMTHERLQTAVILPNVAQTPEIIQARSATSRLMMIGLKSDTVHPTDLSTTALWLIKPKLSSISGVANVAIWGLRQRELQVQIDSERLRDANLLQDDIISTAADALWVTPLTFLKGSTPGAGGWIDNPNQRIGVSNKMPIRTPEDIARVPVTPPHLLMRSKTMELGDIAEMTFNHPLMIGDAVVNDGRGLMLVVEKFPSANALEVTAAVEQALKDLQHGLTGVEINTNVFRLATYIEDSVGNLGQALIIGFILVILLVGALMFNWRTGVVALVSIPLSLLAAIIVLQWTGESLNTMVLAGLVVALGVVIDDAIVVLDRITDRLRARTEDDGTSIARILLDTSMETRGPMVYAALILLLAVLPLFFMGGLSGALFQPMVVSYTLAVMASLVVGLTVTPALSLLLFGRAKPGAGASPVMSGLRSAYEALLNGIVKAPRAVAGVAVAAVVVCLAMWPLLGQSLLPAFKERSIVVDVAAAPGTSNEETYRIVSRMGKELKTLPGVENVGAHVGRAITGDRVVDTNAAQIWLDLAKGADYDKMTATVRKTVRGYIGLDLNVQSYLRDTVSEALSGKTNDMVVRIFGRDFAILNKKADEVRQALSGVEGLVDLRALGQVEKPRVNVNIDLTAASNANIRPGEIRRGAATMFSGVKIGSLFENQKAYDVVVRSHPEKRTSLQNIRDVIIEKANRSHVRLGDVTDVSIGATPAVIQHEYNFAYVDVVANVSGRDLGSVNEEVNALLKKVEFPLEYYPKVLGESVERRNVQNRTIGIMIAGLIGIFLLLQACFGSWRLAAIGFLCIPAAMAGGVLAGLATGGIITLGSIVGFVAVVGIVARNAIVLITHYRQLEADGMPFGIDLVVRGARERMPSILTSSLAIIAALLPIAVMGEVSGLEIIHPTAVIIIAGVIASTLITLLVIPALYVMFGANAGSEPDLGLTDA